MAGLRPHLRADMFEMFSGVPLCQPYTLSVLVFILTAYDDRGALEVVPIASLELLHQVRAITLELFIG